MLKALWVKFKESALSVLPVALIVLILNCTPLVNFTITETVIFACCSLVLILGIALFNLGADIVYSGTIGAIFEAARLGIKGVAFSTDPRTFDDAMSRIDDVWSFFEKENLLALGNIYNVNIPLSDKGIKVTRQGGIYFTDDFKYLGNDMYEQIGAMADPKSCDERFDNVAVIHGYISITPLTSEKTNLSVYEKFEK